MIEYTQAYSSVTNRRLGTSCIVGATLAVALAKSQAYRQVRTNERIDHL